MRQLILGALLAAPAAVWAADPLTEFLSAQLTPVEYVLARVADHRIVIVGESHWQRDDAELIASLVSELRRRKTALAMETLPADRQGDVDRLLTAPEWDQKLANELLREADWPYVQYRDILHAAWMANRQAGDLPPLRVIALGPPRDFRERKIRYDEWMAQLVIDHLSEAGDRRIVVYCGMHHAFTRYLQVERYQRGRATEFMDRMGNMLWRRYGQDVFLIALHKVEWCGPRGEEEKQNCLPFAGRIDCAASRAVGFDVAASPVAELKFPPSSFYARAYPVPRFIDYADGYVWTRPVDQAALVDLIPLDQYAAEHAADPAWISRWDKRRADLKNPFARASWALLPKWRENCRRESP